MSVTKRRNERAVFLDRDGVINRLRRDHVKSLEELVLLPGVVSSMARLSQAGLKTVVVTNQSGVAKGLFTSEVIQEIHRFLDESVVAAGGSIAAGYFCPHREEDKCDCRKPQPGMLLRAAKELRLNLDRCFFVGDTARDIGAANAAGCVAVLVGKKTWEGPPMPEQEVSDLAEATEWILAHA